MKRIHLTQRKVAFVDNEDFERVNQYKWYYNRTVDRNEYARHDIWSNKKKTCVLLHRFIMNPKKDEYVDHINGRSLDCRKENMRICTNQQNAFNIKSKKKNKSGYKGVSPRGDHWIAQITFNYKNIHIGTFYNLKAAAKAYDSKARELFGDFAKTNFVI